MFKGLAAFPLTPLINGRVDEKAFVSLIENLSAARVDTIAPLGSTGSYAYLSREQRARITALTIGADVFYSVVAGLWPRDIRALTDAALKGDEAQTAALNEKFEPLWELFRRHGSLRVIAAAAEICGRVAAPCLPEPLLSLQGEARAQLQAVLSQQEYH
ncbi:dihydrodipicolinate synthase family protein [Cronobacter sakazakii]|nr:dihydrodipicolinate synthase family protein [Cronobacter sakazakii]EKD3164241.1 dihydrodipicolinate synthase family protein [Cronobacter sakazakii]EKD3183634.1 dihydrodipicolinate synthase family protein [Cronobacter sakazakii]EKD3192878.1 dihydrodipicolinate synthase family protein [Cronobacter sakazakii]EKD3202233.1 dihydrodipicolinate synthase family protein [Cronobacter sakazakii]